MKKIKNLLCVMIVMFALGTTAEAVEISVGASTGLDISFLRGKDAKDFDSMLETISEESRSSGGGVLSKIDLMIEVLPFLAIETGLGYESTGIGYRHEELFQGVVLNKVQMFVPVMLRGQYEYKLGVSYASVGVKLGFPLLPYMPYGSDDIYFGFDSPFDEIKSSKFSMDVSFAIGQEFRLGDANYLGIRIGYDLNVIQNFDAEQFKNAGLEAYESHFMDDVEFALTYRYAFGSKWKK